MASSRLLTLPSNGSDSISKRRLDQHVEQADCLWEKLPDSLVGEILAKVPLASLVRMCSVQKRWRDIILSSSGMFPRYTPSHHGRLFFYGFKTVEVYSSSRASWGCMWATMSPQFFQQFKLRGQDLIASAAGILCFLTLGERGIVKFIVCNPITKCYKRVQMLYHGDSEASPINEQPSMPTSPSLDDINFNCFRFTSSLLAGMVVDSNTGHFKLIIAGIHPSSQGTTLVYDSSVDSWKKVASLVDLEGIVVSEYVNDQKPQAVECGKKLYFCFKYGAAVGRLLKFDVEHETWSWIITPEHMYTRFHRNVIEHNGKVILVMSYHQGSRPSFRIQKVFQAFEFQDEEPTLWLPVNYPPFSTIRALVPDMSGVECLGQGDVVFLIGRNASLTVSRTSVREFRRNSMNSYVDSAWEGYRGHESFPLSHIFMPSMLLLK